MSVTILPAHNFCDTAGRIVRRRRYAAETRASEEGRRVEEPVPGGAEVPKQEPAQRQPLHRASATDLVQAVQVSDIYKKLKTPFAFRIRIRRI